MIVRYDFYVLMTCISKEVCGNNLYYFVEKFVLFAKSHKKSEAVNASDCKVIKSRNYSAVGEAIPPKVIEAT